MLTAGGQTCSYPVVETVHNDIFHLVYGPLQSRDSQLATRAQDIAKRTVRSLGGVAWRC